MKNLPLVLALSALSSFAQAASPYKHVLTCFSHEENFATHKFDVFSVANTYDPAHPSHFAEYANRYTGRTDFYALNGNVRITPKDLHIVVGPGPENGGREIGYDNGLLLGTGYKTHDGSSAPNYWTSRLQIKSLKLGVDMTCMKPVRGQIRQPVTQ